MKKLITTIFLLCLIQHCFGQAGRFIGKWDTPEKQSGSSNPIIQFMPNGTAKLYVEGRELFIDQYVIDRKANPIQVELQTNINDQPASIFLLVEFISGNTMKMEIFPPGVEPGKFSNDDPETQMILRRGGN